MPPGPRIVLGVCRCLCRSIGVGESAGDRDESAFGEVLVMLFGGGSEAFDGDEVGAFGAASVDCESEGTDRIAVGGFESWVGC